MTTPKHMPTDRWPEADRQAFAAAYAPGDIFAETCGPGAHLSQGTRRLIETAYKRWLGFLSKEHPADLLLVPAARITPGSVRAYVDRLGT